MAASFELYDEAVKLKDQGKFEEAVAKLQEILVQEPTYALAYSALSIYLGKLQRHDEAVAHAKKACELEPNDPRSYTALSVVCVRAGRIQDAEDAKARAQMMQQQQMRG
ncbi:MAG: tetratricopeptide repeat protein [Planctomycetia bacterium]|nr:tetratricopeptide repeat protein [Planctomycetia bacterium]